MPTMLTAQPIHAPIILVDLWVVSLEISRFVFPEADNNLKTKRFSTKA